VLPRRNCLQPRLSGNGARETCFYFADAKYSFQAWGQLSDASNSAVESWDFLRRRAQKRWTLRFDNPAVLDKLSAVFATVEPHGGASKPSGQKLMYAYLGHTHRTIREEAPLRGTTHVAQLRSGL
jgi:hypothetical protein